MLTKEELIALGVAVGPQIATAFKLIKRAASKDEATSLIKQFVEGTLVKKEKLEIPKDSVLQFFLDIPDTYLIPSAEGRERASRSELRRMLEHGAVTINGFNKFDPFGMLPRPLFEITFFRNAPRQVSWWYDEEVESNYFDCMMV